MLKLKEGINPEILRDYGFKKGKEWSEIDNRYFRYTDELKENSWFLFANEIDWETDEPKIDTIAYTDDSYDIPCVEIWVRDFCDNDLYISCSPAGTYHISGEELDQLTTVLFRMISDGILEERI